MQVEEVLAFPTSVALLAYSQNILHELVPALNKGLKRIGLPDNKKYLSDRVFWGNVTVCRLTHEPSDKFKLAVQKLRSLKIGQLKVEKIVLITCNAVCHPKSRQIIGEYALRS